MTIEENIEVLPGETYDVRLDDGQTFRICGHAFVTPMGHVYFPDHDMYMSLDTMKAFSKPVVAAEKVA